MSNVVPLFKEEEEILVAPTGLEQVMEQFINLAEAQGVDVNSDKFLYETSTIMTLMQVTLNGRA